MSRRTEQMASTLQRAIQEIITRGLQDPRVSGLITVTAVRVSEDKREATVMVSVYPADRQELTMHGLRAAVPHIRHELGELVDMRNTPNLSFKLDSSLKKQATVIDALSKVAEERAKTGKEPAASLDDDSPASNAGDSTADATHSAASRVESVKRPKPDAGERSKSKQGDHSR